MTVVSVDEKTLAASQSSQMKNKRNEPVQRREREPAFRATREDAEKDWKWKAKN